MAQWSGALAAPVEDPGSAPSGHMLPTAICSSSPGDPKSCRGLIRHPQGAQTYTHRAKQSHKIKIFLNKGEGIKMVYK